MNLSQAKRQLSITTALGPEALVINRMVLRERMNAPFEIQAELSSLDATIDFDKVMGHPVSIRLELGTHGKRFFHGYISRFTQSANEGGFARYRATIVPWLWFLTRTSDCRVSQRESVREICEKVFLTNRFGSDFYQFRTSAGYPKRRYCVQYRETDFNFINRLLESEGIFYWFEHTESSHKLIFADRVVSCQPRKGYDALEFHEVETISTQGREVITSWELERQIQAVNYALKDFDFKKPSDPLKGQHEISRKHGLARFAAYDYPGEYYEATDANHYAKLRIEELQASHCIVQASTTARGLAVGQLFTLQKHSRSDQNRQYLITDLTMSIDSGEFASGGAAEEFLRCSFHAIPSDTPYRPPRVTAKPLVQGVQTATVTGPEGEEIHVDEHGRVKVHFHWDRHGKPDDESSCWVRVGQPWAGTGFGYMNIPRIGQEVIVEFLEGDPDRPIINGRVYNAEQKPPFELPANKTQSGVKSRSTLEGSAENCNEIRFEDKKGSEELVIHAEKDQHISVENDETHTVGHDRQKTIDHDETSSIGNNRTESVGTNESISIGNNRSEDVGKNEDISIGENRTETVGKNETITIAGTRQENVAKDEKLEVGGTRTDIIAKDDKQQIGKKFALVAGDEILLQTGDASISLKKNGDIQIKGKNITIIGSSKIGIKASSDLTLKGSKIAEN